MTHRRRLLARVLTTTLAIGVVAGTPTAASAEDVAPIVVAPVAGLPTANRYNVVPQCTATAGVATSMHQITYVVVATAEAYSTDGTPVVATGVHCDVIDSRTGDVYGGTPPIALPGPFAASPGVVTVPFNSKPKLCAYGNALFANNATASRSTC